MRLSIYFNVHLVSDSTGETLNAVMRAATAQFDRVHAAVTRSYAFADRDAAREHFTRLTGLFRNLNYAPEGSQEEARLLEEIRTLDRSVPLAGHHGAPEAADPA